MNAPAIQTAPGTPHQRLFARTLMQRLELDTRRVTLFHRRFFEAAKLPTWPLGDDLDAVLCGFTRTQMSALIDALKAEVCDE